MSTAAALSAGQSPFEQLRYARQIILLESQALARLATRLDTEFCRAVDLFYGCAGSVIVSGMGKAGLVGQKIAATLASTGTRSHFLHPAEAVHGDLGRIHHDDLLLVLSKSGETEEIVRLLPTLSERTVPIVAITSRPTSSLGKAADVTIDLGPLKEACALGLAPSTSTTAMLAMGDALALVTSRMRDFRVEDFARFHPAGSLGHKLKKVEDQMRRMEECQLASESDTVRQVITHWRGGRRSGAVIVVDDEGRLAGFFTDSDFRRLFALRQEASLDRPIAEVMTRQPITVPAGSMLADAESIVAERKISELPVVDADGRPLGMIDITDLPRAKSASPAPPARSVGPPRPKHLSIREPSPPTTT